MRYFGEPWDAPFCKNAKQVSTPVGSLCFECGEPVKEGERGILISLVGGGSTVAEKPHHAECFLFSMVGDMVFTWQEDPHFRPTYRMQAREVWRLTIGAREPAPERDPFGLVLAVLMADTYVLGTRMRRVEVHEQGCLVTPNTEGWTVAPASEIQIAQTIRAARERGITVEAVCPHCEAWPYESNDEATEEKKD